MSDELQQAEFKEEYHPTNIPSRNLYSFEVDLDITEDMLSWINTAIIVNSNLNTPLFGIGHFEIPRWRDYWRVYGDGLLLWEGSLDGPQYKIVDLISYRVLRIAPSTYWRGKYHNDIYEEIDEYPSDYEVYWTIFTDPNLKRMEFTIANSDDSTKTLILPEKTNTKTVTWTPPDPPPTPTPPDYPIPPYSQIRVSRNVPDMEYFPDSGTQSAQYASSQRKTIYKIGENKYKLTIIGDLYSFPLSKLVEEQSFPVFDKIFPVELWEDLTIYDDRYIWKRGYRYNFSSTPTGSITKEFYTAESEQLDIKLLVSIINPTTFQEVKQYSLTNITGVRG
jgi:hypothetical protein